MLKWLKKEKGFTLVEMMIVMLVITIILLVALPNVTTHSSAINKKGCAALIQMVQGQAQAYELENGVTPTMEQLITEGYVKQNEEDGKLRCPNGSELEIVDGKVQEK
ncbi:competence type IV pilus major pilin ComGC [Bacillus sp. FJAT-50079]|uniref:competence type IV pilus major pilin ComGC n=1 Tax=Bacillus sp. FJAT-50079 TaxID=2833577 RepID=UPI001BC9234D|nr:competence type IV pilus major pilin ComGC [Bacillus sp. FJAT-50079]MBS4209609.1 prepilin-type N-terminal cleavage/methylation domain-containing protein [Bacillus sp. FJAT-50079]